MKKLIIAGCSLALILGATAVFYNQDNFNALGRMFQPPPEGYVVGKDNGPGKGLHHAGEDCASCHAMGGKADMYQWTMAGTLYADRAGRIPLKGGEVILQDRDGNVISMTSNEVGNFWTLSPIASNPYAVASHNGPAVPLYELETPEELQMDLRSWQVKAWVKRGNAIRPMLTIIPAGGSTGMAMSCGMHHGVMGSRGALWVSSGSCLSAYPEEGLSYNRHIYPILREKCSPCHIPGSTMTRLVTKSDIETPSTSFDFSHGLDLMTYEGSMVSGIAKMGITKVVDTANPEESLVLNKTVPGAMHGGGSFWKEGDPDFLALKQWITEGALKN